MKPCRSENSDFGRNITKSQTTALELKTGITAEAVCPVPGKHLQTIKREQENGNCVCLLCICGHL